MKWTLLFGTTMLLFLSDAQNIAYTFYIIDVNTRQPIEQALCYDLETKLAFTSNLNGEITFISNSISEMIGINHLSFQVIELKLDKELDSIFLVPKDYILPEFYVNEFSAEDIVKKAINQISSNYPNETQYITGKYLQTHIENGKYVRYIEAKMEVENLGYLPSIKKEQEQKFKPNAVRKSFVYEKNDDQHGDHLLDLFRENPIQYLETSFLNKNNLQLYHWNLAYTESGLFQINFKNKDWSSLKNLSGFLIINPQNYAIEYIELIEFPNLQSLHENKSNWKFVNGWYQISFKAEGPFYQLEFCNKWYNHQVMNELNKAQTDYLVKEKFSWVSTSTSPNTATTNFVKASNLYTTKQKYIPELWQNDYIKEAIRTDLEVNYPLEFQFENL